MKNRNNTWNIVKITFLCGNRWADENKMNVNHSKTKSMIVCSKPKFRGLDGENLNVRTDKGQLDSVVESKLLGIKLDNCLTWENHMACVKEKIGKRLGLLKRTKKFLSLKARTLFYNSIIQPILDYGAVVWGSNNKRKVQDFVKLAKRCARIILDKKWNTPSRPLFKELNCLPFDKIMEFLRNIVLKALNNLAPNYIWAMFTMSSDIHNAGTRNAKHNLILPKVRTSMAKNAFRFSAARSWNELPKDIKEAQSISTFSLKLKTYLSWP